MSELRRKGVERIHSKADPAYSSTVKPDGEGSELDAKYSDIGEKADDPSYW